MANTADIPLVGGIPQAADIVQGGLWLALYIPVGGDPEDGSPVTVQLNAYAYQVPYAIDWGDGSYSADPATWTGDYAPSGGSPGLWTAQHDYKANGFWSGYVEAGVRANFKFNLRYKPAMKHFDKTVPELERAARDDMKVARGGGRLTGFVKSGGR